MKPKSKTRTLKGWTKIAEFLGPPVSVAQRWQKEGMPVIREGRLVSCSFGRDIYLSFATALYGTRWFFLYIYRNSAK